MSFITHVRNCAYYRFSDFSGRSSRTEFWSFMLALFAVSAILTLFASAAPVFGGWILWGFQMAAFIPYTAALVRRFHDVGLSGYWVAAPYLIAILSFAVIETPGLEWLVYASPAAFLAALLVCVLPGAKGANRWGAPC